VLSPVCGAGDLTSGPQPASASRQRR
jgi:hypothetical protein